MERDLNTRGNSAVNGFTSLGQTNGDLKIDISYDDQSVNIGLEPVPLKDPRTSAIEIMEERKVKNSVEGIECELLINQEIKPIYEVDVDGTIYLSDIKSESDNYEINNMAELIFNFES